jgi:hypothetical protein
MVLLTVWYSNDNDFVLLIAPFVLLRRGAPSWKRKSE